MEGYPDLDLHWLLESVPDAVVLVDDKGRIVGANAAMASLFGYAEEEDLLGLGIEDLVPARLRDDHARWRRERAEGPRDRPMGTGLGIVARRRDGSEFRADIQLRTRQVPGGSVTMAVVRDLTESSRVLQLSSLLQTIRSIASTLVHQVDPHATEHGLALEICEAVERAIELERARAARRDNPER